MKPSHRLIVLAVLAMLTLCVAPFIQKLVRHVTYYREVQFGREQIVQLQNHRPIDVTPETWEHATGWAVTAYCNVCFSPGHVSYDELRRFNQDTAKRFRGSIDLSTVDWIWERLGQTGPHGLDYRYRFEPQYREGLVKLPDR